MVHFKIVTAVCGGSTCGGLWLVRTNVKHGVQLSTTGYQGRVDNVQVADVQYKLAYRLNIIVYLLI